MSKKSKTKNKNNIILLDRSYLPVSKINWKKALKLILLDKAESLDIKEDRIVINTVLDKKFTISKVIRLLHDSNVKIIRKKFTPYSRKAVYRRDNYKCGYCLSEDNLTLDHVIPSSRGGTNTFENTVTACRDCNNVKGDKTPPEANMVLKHKLYPPTIFDIMNKLNKEFIDLDLYRYFDDSNT